MEKTTVSVVMATYNRLDYLKKSLSSIVCQISKDDEIIISDDGSDQDTLDYLRYMSSNYNNIKLFNHNNFGNIDLNMRYAFEKCTKDVIIIQDSDDISLENRIDIIKKFFESHSDCELYYHNAKIIDENDNIVSENFFKSFKQKPNILSCLIKATFYGCCMSLNAKFVKKYISELNGAISWDRVYGLISLAHKKCFFESDKFLLWYRRWKNNASVKKKNSLKHKINERKRWYKFYNKHKKEKIVY